MLISHDEIIGLPVETKSGQRLGKVSGFVLDNESQKIIHYLVKKTGLLAGITKKDLLVHYEQVILITKEKMVVDDNVVKDREGVQESVPASM